MSERIPLARPVLGDEELRAVEKVLRSGQLTGGPVVAELETALCQRTGRKYALAVSSATAALELALWAFKIQPDDEVLVPAFAFPAAAGATRRLGAIPVPIDVDRDGWNLDLISAQAALSPKTRAIISIDQFGLVAEATPLLRFAKEAGLPLLSDAACSLGGTDSTGRPAGSYGDVSVFSFHPRKIVTCGEGGALLTDDDALFHSLSALRNQGQSAPGAFARNGTNARLSAVHAAIMLPQMARLDELADARARHAAAYRQELAPLIKLGQVRPQVTPAGARHVYQSFALCLARSVDRARVLKGLQDEQIECNVATYSCTRIPAFATAPRPVPQSEELHDHAMSLPLFPGMESAQIKRVADCLTRALV